MLKWKMTRLLLFVFLLSLGSCSSDVSVYVDDNELQRLLGVRGELWYLRHGEKKTGALYFVLPVPHDVHHVHLVVQPHQQQVKYVANVSVDPSDALHVPQLNVSSSGVIESKIVLRASLVCNDKFESELNSSLVDVKMSLKLADVHIIVRRSKHCVWSKKSEEVELVEEVEVVTQASELSVDKHLLFLSLTSALIASVVAWLLFLVVLNWLRGRRWALLKSRREKQCMLSVVDTNEEARESQQRSSQRQQPQQHPITHPMVPWPHERPGSQLSSSSPMLLRRPPPPESSPPPPPPGQARSLERRFPDAREARRLLRSMHVDRHLLKLDDDENQDGLQQSSPMMQGNYARLVQGTLQYTALDRHRVLVKCIVNGNTRQIDALLRDSLTLYNIGHRHVLNAFAATMLKPEPDATPAVFMLIYPYMSHNLKLWLQLSDAEKRTISTHNVVHMASQVSEALDFLHGKNIVHTDIAARNCFLLETARPCLIRLCDSGLSRDLFRSDYHCLGDNTNRPVRWMPPELLHSQINLSSASDMWSFGVLLWELMTRAQTPFGSVDPFEQQHMLESGLRLNQPINCPDALYSLMDVCWHGRPELRMTAAEMRDRLAILQSELQQFV